MQKLSCILVLSSAVALAQTTAYQPEGLPDHIVARVQVRDRFLAELPQSTNGFGPQFVIETLKKWTPGSTIKVAFNGGDNSLRKKVVDAASVWLSHGNIKLDFGFNAATGAYRDWSASDSQYASEIRISFDQAGYWSMVGRDSNDPSVIHANEASMNFGGFAISMPFDYAAVVAHEFGHAFGFQHEHQSPVSGCDSQFRWFDDPLYQPTTDTYGQYIADPQQRRPGLYTVLGGPPNQWPSPKVDFNLRQLPNSSAYHVGTFDPHSIMMYSFPSWMFVSATSSCFTNENLALSTGDISGFAQTYPFAAQDVTARINLQHDFAGAILNSEKLSTQAKQAFQSFMHNN